MNNLQEKINTDLKQAMRDKNEVALSTLRLLSAALKNKTIALRQGAEVVLDDEQIAEVIASEIKKRHDSVEAYTAGNRPELAVKEQSEIDLLKKYLPEQASDEEIEKIVKEIVAAGLPAGEAGAADFGKTMGQAMARLKGKADGKRVGEAVKKVLGSR
jgi:uncharacterized protein YqeY